jgi:hypothetical protein
VLSSCGCFEPVIGSGGGGIFEEIVGWLAARDVQALHWVDGRRVCVGKVTIALDDGRAVNFRTSSTLTIIELLNREVGDRVRIFPRSDEAPSGSKFWRAVVEEAERCSCVSDDVPSDSCLVHGNDLTIAERI